MGKQADRTSASADQGARHGPSGWTRATRATLLYLLAASLWVVGSHILLAWRGVPVTPLALAADTPFMLASGLLLHLTLRRLYDRERALRGRALESARQAYDLFAENQAVMLIFDPDLGEVADANPTAASYYGYPLAELRGLPFSRLAEGGAGAGGALVPRPGGPPVRQRHRLRDGRVRDVEILTGTLAGKNRSYVYGIVVDVTEQVRTEATARERKLLLQALVESMPDGLLVVSSAGRWLFWNGALSSLWVPRLQSSLATAGSAGGAAADDPILASEITPGGPCLPASFLARQVGQGVRRDEVRLPNGRTYERLSIAPPVGGTDLGRIWSYRDITDRRLAAVADRLLQQVNEAVLADQPTGQWMPRLCDELAEELGMPLAWLSRKEADGRVEVIARGGRGTAFTDGLLLRWDEGPMSLGPTGRAIRGHATVVADINDSGYALWSDRARALGFSTSVCLPLIVGDQVIGGLTCYSEAHDTFSGPLLLMLEEVARGVAVAWSSAQAKDRLRKQDLALQHAANAVLIADKQGRIEWVNKAFIEMTGYMPEEVVGQTPAILKSGQHEAGFYRRLWRTIQAGHPFKADFVNRRKDGTLYHSHHTIAPVMDEAGAITHFIAIQEDVTARHVAEERLLHLAGHDPLTDLPNRLLFGEELARALAGASRRGEKVAVMFLDLDRFKTVNDALGHSVGDALLQSVAHRLRGALRGGDVLARLGGDEFAILQAGIAGPDDAAALARRLTEALADPVPAADHHIRTSISVGITLYPDDGSDPSDLLRNADLAMYRAKQEGRNTHRFFASAMDQSAQVRADIEAGLHAALERQEFLLHWQPQVELSSGRIRGAEVLVRWDRPGVGLVSPGLFIPVAEDIGLIGPLGRWVLREAVRQAAAWRAAGLDLPRVSVNLSFAQFQDADLPGQVKRVLAEFGLPPDVLELELTESMLAQEPASAVAATEALRAIGIQLAIDDFGTGYSSLSYLTRFAVNRLKIDRSFVNDLGAGEGASAIIRATASLAHSLGLGVVAEGVETMAQAAFLRDAGVDEAQGYLFARPLDAAGFQERLSADRQTPAAA